MSNSKKIKSLCVCAVLSALYVALEIIATYMSELFFGGSFQIPISCFPLILASVMFGPVWGTATGIVGSFLSQLLSPYGLDWSTVLWMIPTILYSLVIAILFISFKKNENRVILGIEFLISQLILSASNVLVNFYFNYVQNLSNALLKIFLPVKLGMGIVFAIIFAFIVPPIISKIKKIL